MLFRKDVGNGILLDRPLPFKLHQSYRPLPCFIPALQEIWSGPAKKQCGDGGDGGDDLNTAVGISLPRWSGYAVIVTALHYRQIKQITDFLSVSEKRVLT